MTPCWPPHSDLQFLVRNGCRHGRVLQALRTDVTDLPKQSIFL
mgnify:CR=1 FL=1